MALLIRHSTLALSSKRLSVVSLPVVIRDAFDEHNGGIRHPEGGEKEEKRRKGHDVIESFWILLRIKLVLHYLLDDSRLIEKEGKGILR